MENLYLVYLDVQFVKIKNPEKNFFPRDFVPSPFVFQEFDVTFRLWTVMVI